MLKRVALVITIVGTPLALTAEQSNDRAGTFQDVARAMSEAMRLHHYDPAALADPAYVATKEAMAALAARVQSREDFVRGANAVWHDGPFSHVDLQVAQASADETAAYLDTLRVGGGGARLTWNSEVAVLTVTTMMGVDTIEEITAAYADIAGKGARALIIDLRENGGGAFAVKPLVGHLIDAPVDAGVFVSRKWAMEMDRAPTQRDVSSLPPWEGWTLTSFWRDVEANRLTRVQFQPTAPLFSGPVYVLVSQRTASAAELAADVLRSSGRAVLVGQTTAGEMLTQKVFDLPQGLQVFLPIGDYYSLRSGRIEGVGVMPHVQSEADSAMAVALSLAARR